MACKRPASDELQDTIIIALSLFPVVLQVPAIARRHIYSLRYGKYIAKVHDKNESNRTGWNADKNAQGISAMVNCTLKKRMSSINQSVNSCQSPIE